MLRAQGKTALGRLRYIWAGASSGGEGNEVTLLSTNPRGQPKGLVQISTLPVHCKGNEDQVAF